MTNLIIPERPSHWYHKDGRPCYELPMKTKPGQTRPPTVRDAKELDLLPSVTGFNNVLYKPALESWKMMQTVLSALTLPRNMQETEDDFARRVVQDSQAESRRAADFGTTVHALAEAYLKNQIPDSITATEMTFLEGFMAWCRVHTVEPEALELSFGNWELGVGGRVDFIGNIRCENWGVTCGCSTRLDGYYVADWKTQGTKEGKPFNHYNDWCVQLAGYVHGLELEHVAQKVSLVISSTEPGRLDAHLWDDSETDWGWEIFKACRKIWYSPLGPGWELNKLRGMKF